jgi:hypothetical protein
MIVQQLRAQRRAQRSRTVSAALIALSAIP